MNWAYYGPHDLGITVGIMKLLGAVLILLMGLEAWKVAYPKVVTPVKGKKRGRGSKANRIMNQRSILHKKGHSL